MKNNQLKTIAACVAMLGCCPSLWAADGKKEESATTKTLDSIVVIGNKDKDQVGRDRVYTRDIVNLYKSRDEIETFKGQNVADLLSGLSGVYSGEARNSGAIDPNIRGVQGQGRIPVTVDGTEQALTVWRGYAGANNRNYIDPNLISSIYVEKGPSMTRGVKSGIGGSLTMKTIDADDIVPKGQKYGVEIKVETADNSIERRKNTYEDTVDYRTLPEPSVATGGIWRAFFDDTDRIDQRFSGQHKFFKDNAYRIAAATKQDKFDLMLAYAYRNKGNYFSGTKGAQRYGYRGPWTQELVDEIIRREEEAAAKGEKFWGSENLLGAPNIANIGLFYHPGGEVSNTSLSTESVISKGTLRLPNKQTLKFGLRHTDTTFGDIMPSRIIGPISQDYRTLNKISEWPLGGVKQKSYNIDYSWKPEGSRWIDLEATLWQTRTNSKTNTTGGAPGATLYEDMSYGRDFDLWRSILTNWKNLSEEERQQYTEWGLDKRPDPSLPNTNGRFNTIQAQEYHAQNNRDGITLSNRMKLSDKLSLTLNGDVQYEKLRSRNNFSDELRYGGQDKYTDEINQGLMRANYELNQYGVPRNGRRHEYNLGFNFRYEPTHWLTLTTGARYTHFSINDDSRMLKEETPLILLRGKEFVMTEAVSKKEFDKSVARWSEDFGEPYQGIPPDFNNYVGGFYYNDGFYEDHYHSNDKSSPLINVDKDKSGALAYWNKDRRGPVIYWDKDESGRLRVKDNPLLNGSIPDIREKVANFLYDPNDPKSRKMIPKYYLKDVGSHWGAMTDAERRRAQHQGGSGWAPAFSATVNFTDYARAYLRYTETLRYPSIFEGTYGFSSASGGFGQAGYGWKPEHGKNWEIGYVHDLTGIFPKMRRADYRINYFHNTTKDIIDRDEDFNFQQYDKQIRTGLELQARFDTGRLFGNIGVMRTIKNKMCDHTYPYSHGNLDFFTYHNYIESNDLNLGPYCNNGGLSDTGYLASALQPMWSIDSNLGTRFFGEKLETGVRFHFHSRIKKNRNDVWNDFNKKRGKKNFEDTVQDWQPVALWDFYLRYNFNKNISAEFVGTNIGNRYYLDPLSPSYMPGPGRTLRLGIKAKF